MINRDRILTSQYSTPLAELEYNTHVDYSEVEKRLGKYKRYLFQIENYLRNNAPIIKNEPYTNPVYPTDTWIISDEIQDDSITHVWELDDAEKWKKFKKEDGIPILERDPAHKAARLAKKPKTPKLVLEPDLYQIKKQRRAMQDLTGNPTEEHIPLLDLFLDRDDASWQHLSEKDVNKWYFLDDDEYDGVDRQRAFVRKALGTPDFAFLEGPPGSGKTTVLCELVQQMILDNKRVLITASTHVAIDNLIEKLVAKNRRDLVLVRMGQKIKLAEGIQEWHYDSYIGKKQKDILDNLESKDKKRPSAKMMEVSLRRKPADRKVDGMEGIVRDCTNVVCGTPIGILRHPDLREGSRRFDMLIIDEASKTTFQEFLVPAMHADRWVIVGDTKQLDPYTDDEMIGGIIGGTLPDRRYQDICLDAFLASEGKDTATPTEDEIRGMYQTQCTEAGCGVHDADNSQGRPTGVMIGSPRSILNLDYRKPKIVIRNLELLEEYCKGLKGGARAKAKEKLNRWKEKMTDRDATWGSEVGWRMKLDYVEKRDNQKKIIEESGDLPYRDYDAGRRDGKHWEELNRLMPSEKLGNVKRDDIWRGLKEIQRMAYPSILESIQYGFLGDGGREDSTMESGMDRRSFEMRHVLLSHQYRMHPDIARFAHEHIYKKMAMMTPDALESKREWKYTGFKNRLAWLHVGGKCFGRSSEPEARAVIAELERFTRFASGSPKKDGKAWEVAVLTFYLNQERELRGHLQNLVKKKSERHFKKGNVSIELCSVDRYQGHEADVVFLSLANDHPTPFLANPNRLNVAVTRARFLCVIVGNHEAMRGGDKPLSSLAGMIEPRRGKA